MMSVQLVIKSAAQSVPDFKLECKLSWTIEELKDELSSEYPTKPIKENQKLIYGGKLLPNHLKLESIFKDAENCYVLHLVCPPPPMSEAKTSERENTMPAFAAPPVNAANPYVQMNPQISAMPGLSYQVPVSPVPDPASQYLMMQQMYTQLMTQYLSQYNGMVPMVIPPAPVTPQQQQPPQPPVAVPPQQNAAQRPPRREEERDYIDHFYGLSRIAMFVAFLLLYSSFTRIMAVMTAIVFINWLIKLYREHQRREQQIQELRERQTTERTSQVDSDTSQDSDSTNDESSSQSSEDEPSTPAGVPEVPQRSLTQNVSESLSVVCSLFTAFFTSLIPQENALH